MKKQYSKKLRCNTCGGEDFEFNENKSYVKCNKCGREYLGGYKELLQYNQDVQDEVFEEMKKDAENIIIEKLKQTFKNNKNITFN